MLILDEATNALDARTEREVCNNLSKNFEVALYFLLHRLSTVRPADIM